MHAPTPRLPAATQQRAMAGHSATKVAQADAH